jgi:hypothetical protein
MRTILTILFIISLVCNPILGGVVRGEVANLSIDQKITAKIKAFDKKFFKGFDIYLSGTQDTSMALLFDRKDQYRLPAPDLAGPLSENEIINAIKLLNQQYKDQSWYVPVQPRALNIVNSKREVLGYLYTGVETTQVDLRKDGLVAVYPPFKNLSEDHEVTTEIRVFDKQFLKNFDVYAAGEKEAPLALLLDSKKDKYHIPSRFWGTPLTEQEIIYNITSLDKQYYDRTSNIPRLPRALRVVNSKGQILGYVHTGIYDNILMDIKKDGQVTVYPPSTESQGSAAGSVGGGPNSTAP